MAFKQNIVKNNFPIINKFYHEVNAVIKKMHDITVGLLEHIDITPKLDLDISIKYMERILRRPAMNKFWQVMLECKELEKGLSGDQWSIGLVKSVTMEQFYTWDKDDWHERTWDPISGAEHCAYFEKELWFELGKRMWRKHRSVFQDNVK